MCLIKETDAFSRNCRAVSILYKIGTILLYIQTQILASKITLIVTHKKKTLKTKQFFFLIQEPALTNKS